MSMRRRHFLCLGCGMALVALGCAREKDKWPAGMEPIKWDRDTCVRCNMVISDPRFAAEMRGGEKDVVFKFDDVGCLVFWLRDKAAQHPWMAEPATRLWVADANDASGKTWLDARRARYRGGRLSPMGYNFAAVGDAASDGLTFEEMRARVLAKGK
jgi:nitrous oxide reductase accessory protein NosL